MLTIQREVSDVSTQVEGAVNPTIPQRDISTIVSVASGQTVILGGLISERQSVSDTGIPVLQDIPLVGGIFTGNSDERQRTELIILITPKVIRNAIDAQAAAEEIRARMNGLVPATE